MPEIDEKLARAYADFENLRKKVEHRVGQARTEGEEAILQRILEPLEDLHRAIQGHQGECGNGMKRRMLDSMSSAAKAFERALDVERISAVGQPYDPRTMEAVGLEDVEGVPPGHVARQGAGGYVRRGKLLRAGKVTVTPRKG